MTLVMQATPKMTRHALERCQEMGISSKVAKRIVRHATLVRPGNRITRDAYVATSDGDPLYAVVFYPGDPPVIVTVLFRTYETYARRGATFDPIVPEADDD